MAQEIALLKNLSLPPGGVPPEKAIDSSYKKG